MMMNQHEGLIPEGLGERLSRARLARGWTVNEVARRLKLAATIITELESDQGGAGDAAVYRRGYCLNYARLLGIDDENLRKAVTRRYKPVPAPLIPAVPRSPKPRIEHYLRMFTYAVGSFVIVIPLVWSLTQGAASFFPLVDSSAGEPGGNGSEPTAADAERNPEPQPLPTAASPPPYLSASAAPPLAATFPNRESASTPAAAITAAAESVAVGDAGDDTTMLVLAVGADSWVEIHDATERRVEYDLLRADTRHEYKGVPPFRLLIGQASAVKVYYHNKPIDLAPYTRGNVASFTLDLADQEKAGNEG